jgi:oligopeptide/dipeptide ABC transporter ATP-binding protein
VSERLLEVRDLRVGFPTRSGVLYAADGVSFTLDRGEVLGLVGESGSGKSVTCRALLRLVPAPGEIVSGEILLDGRDLVEASPRELRAVRGRDVAMVFQDPLSALDPLFTVGDQLLEVLTHRLGLPRRQASARALELLEHVGIPSARSRMGAYSHELSGGMRQRIMIALALAGEPRLLLADEPTTSLDVTIQDQILHLLLELRRETGMAMVLVSHDMGVIAQTCDRVAVMYAGRLFEVGPAEAIFARPKHPYTRALLAAIPSLEARGEAIRPIGGQPPDLARLPSGCPFALRCAYARPECTAVPLELEEVEPRHTTACPFETVETPEAAVGAARP